MTLLFRKSLERRTVFGFVVWFKTAEADIVHLQGYRTHKSTTIFLVCSQLLQKTFIFSLWYGSNCCCSVCRKTTPWRVSESILPFLLALCTNIFRLLKCLPLLSLEKVNYSSIISSEKSIKTTSSPECSIMFAHRIEQPCSYYTCLSPSCWLSIN